jgi:hypothetical protein
MKFSCDAAQMARPLLAQANDESRHKFIANAAMPIRVCVCMPGIRC